MAELMSAEERLGEWPANLGLLRRGVVELMEAHAAVAVEAATVALREEIEAVRIDCEALRRHRDEAREGFLDLARFHEGRRDAAVQHAEAVEKERDAALADVAKLREELAATFNLSEQYRFEAGRARKDEEFLRKKRDAALAQLSVMTARCEKSEVALNRALTHADQAEAQLAAVKRELGEAYTNSERLQAELDGAAHRADQAEAQLAERTRERDDLDKELSETANCTAEATAYHIQRDDARAKLAKAEAEVARLTALWERIPLPLLLEVNAALAPEPAKEG